MEANRKFLENELILVEQAKTDDQAFSALYDFYFPKIYYFILKRVGHRETAEDLTASIFLKAFSNLKKFKVEHSYSFCAWLYRIATNSLTDYYRRQSRKTEINLDSIVEPSDQRPDIVQGIAAVSEGKIVRQALLELDGREREALELKFFAELSNLEIAATLNLSANNAGVIIYRALKKFKAIYQKYDE